MPPVPTTSAPISTHSATPTIVTRSLEPPQHPPPYSAAAPDANEARGFALYVGISSENAVVDGTNLPNIVEALKKLALQLAPSCETYAAVALAPRGAGGRDVDVVRLALQERNAIAKRGASRAAIPPHAQTGLVIDISRKRVLLDNVLANLTYKEFELLQYVVLREGRTIDRLELLSSLWKEDASCAPNERTIDVHVRRLRSKLGRYEDIVRTVRGSGYRFDHHADVSILKNHAPSPDVF